MRMPFGLSEGPPIGLMLVGSKCREIEYLPSRPRIRAERGSVDHLRKIHDVDAN